MSSPPHTTSRSRLASVASTTLVVSSVVGLILLAWLLRYILLLFFGATVAAVIIRSAADLVRKLVPVGSRWSVAIACVIIGGVLVGFVLLLGTQIAAQLSTLRDAIPAVTSLLKERFGLDVQQWLDEASAFSWISGALGYVPSVFSVGSAGILVVVGAIFLALDPSAQREGLLQLVPPRHRDKLRKTVQDAGRALQLWLVGQLIAMVIIGVSTAALLIVLGVPSALALGLIAALLEFIPYAGAILVYFPLGVAGLSQGMSTFWWLMIGYVAIQQIESNVLQPIIQERTVQLPPVLTLFAIVAFAVLFGPLGILLGVPLSLVLFVAVKELYIEDVLGEPVSIPGERPP